MTTMRPTLDDVKRAVGDEVLLDAVRRSVHDHYDAVISAEELLPVVEKVWDGMLMKRVWGVLE